MQPDFAAKGGSLGAVHASKRAYCRLQLRSRLQFYMEWTCVQGIVYGKPVNQGITQLKPKRNLKSVAEERAGRKLGGLRVLNSYWVNQASPVACRPRNQNDTVRVASLFALKSSVLIKHAIADVRCLQDSTYKYYEIILIDPEHNAIRRVRSLCVCMTLDRLHSPATRQHPRSRTLLSSDACRIHVSTGS